MIYLPFMITISCAMCNISLCNVVFYLVMYSMFYWKYFTGDAHVRGTKERDKPSIWLSDVADHGYMFHYSTICWYHAYGLCMLIHVKLKYHYRFCLSYTINTLCVYKCDKYQWIPAQMCLKVHSFDTSYKSVLLVKMFAAYRLCTYWIILQI